MNAIGSTESGKLERLARLLDQDPANALLLADVAQAALAAGDFDAADRWIAQGIRSEGETPAWRFRLASLRMAQRRLAQARELLVALLRDGVELPAVQHNIAYIDFLEGDYAACARRLEPWVTGGHAGASAAEAVATLWLRAQHHLLDLEGALRWVRHTGPTRVGPAAGGVASLIALDAGHLPEAAQWSALALQAQPGQLDASIARAGVALARGAADEAVGVLQGLAGAHAHQPRVWSLLGFAHLLQGQYAPARDAFKRSLEWLPHEAQANVGLGWACMLGGESESAAAAFQAALAADADSADAHGGLALVHALRGERGAALPHVQRAQALRPGQLAAQLAQALLAGDAQGLARLRQAARELLAQLAASRSATR